MHTYRVTVNEWLTQSTIRVTLEPDMRDKRPFIYSPGQYAALSFVRRGRPSVARCFSIVSSPTDPYRLQFSMRTRGRFTSALTKVKVGDIVQVRGPYGGFVYDPVRHGDSVFIAGGIGITPLISMVKYATDTRSERKISLIYGVQSQDDMPFHADLDTLQSQNQNLDVTYAVSKGPTDAITVGQAVSGRVRADLLSSKLAGGSRTVFVCGPPPFMNGMVKALRDQGVPRRQIITEAFNQGPNRQTGKVASWPQNMYTLGALGIGIGSLAIMVSEIVKSLPNVPLTDEQSPSTPLTSGSERQKDLDTLVNNLAQNLNRPASPTTVSAAPATPATPTTPSSSASSSTTVAPRTTVSTPVAATSSPTPAAAPAPAPAPAPTPAPVRVPKCTTSQSGVTTCV